MSRIARLLGIALVPVLAVHPAPAQTLIRDTEIERTIERMSAPVLQAAGLPPSTVDFYLISSRELNAFVAGGRNIFLYTGLIRRLETPEELLGVIAHETGHIAGGHLIRRAIAGRNATGPAALGLLVAIAAGIAGAGDAAAAIAGGTQAALQRSFLAFSRTEEASADQAALGYLSRAGVDPDGLLEVMRIFRGQDALTPGNVDPYVRTHPLSTTRFELAERRIREIQAARAFTADAETDYWYARMRAKLEGFLDRPDRVLARYADAPVTEPSLYAMAVAYHRLPDVEMAVATIDRLIALRPEDAYYWELKGQILFESGRGAAAVAPYRRAVALAPEAPLIAGGLGRALLALGDPAADREALTVLEAARRSDVGDAAVLRDLATAYARSGNDAMAALATAERFALAHRIEDAVRQANRAAAGLDRGSPAWLRAQDILALEPQE